MSDHQGFVTILIYLLPAFLALWAWGLRAVLRDARRPTATGPRLARCGMPDRPLGPCPASAFLHRHMPRRIGPLVTK